MVLLFGKPLPAPGQEKIHGQTIYEFHGTHHGHVLDTGQSSSDPAMDRFSGREP
jgi:hypothetical protein